MFGFLKDKLKGAISKIADAFKAEPKALEEPEKEIEQLQEKEQPVLKELEEQQQILPEPSEIKPQEISPQQTLASETQEVTIAEKPKVISPELPSIPKRVKQESTVPEKHVSKQKKIIVPEHRLPAKPVVEEKPRVIEEYQQTVDQDIAKIHQLFEEEAKQVIEKEMPSLTLDAAKKEAESQSISEILEEMSISKAHQEEPTPKKGFFQKIKEKVLTTTINQEQFDKFFWDLELAMLENNVAVEVIEKIKKDLKQDLVEKPIKRTAIAAVIQESLTKSLEELFASPELDIWQAMSRKKPYVICFVGINGSGKTTTIAKMAKMFMGKGKSVVLAAADTFRAAAIDQLEEHGKRLGVRVIKHDYGSDPAAVAFDAIKHAEAKNIDVVLIDTAGRMHSNTNLVDEMKKIIRVAKPDLKIFVGESITGNDCVEQAKKFDEAISIDGIILAKADVDEKGGAAISVSYVTGKPILYLGTGQEYGDLKEFDPKLIIQSLGLAS